MSSEIKDEPLETTSDKGSPPMEVDRESSKEKEDVPKRVALPDELNWIRVIF